MRPAVVFVVGKGVSIHGRLAGTRPKCRGWSSRNYTLQMLLFNEFPIEDTNSLIGCRESARDGLLIPRVLKKTVIFGPF